MRAAVNTRYGSPDVVKIREVPKPEPKAGEVLVRVHATTVNRTDWGMLRGHPFFIRFFYGLRHPKRTILGMDFAGVVEAAGAGVTAFNAGARVFGMLRFTELGAHAEYFCVSQNSYIAEMPSGMRFEEAVVCEGAFYGYSSLRALGLKPGQEILIYGASGAIGTAALQLAKSMGANVTAVVATRHLQLVKSLGADCSIDYTAQDFTRIGKTFDCVLDAVGKTTFFRCRKLLKPDATFAVTDMGPWGQTLVLAIWSSLTGGRIVIPLPRPIEGFASFLKARMEAGEFRAVIDRTYPLEKIADAYRYVAAGQKTGIVVIAVTPLGEDRRA